MALGKNRRIFDLRGKDMWQALIFWGIILVFIVVGQLCEDGNYVDYEVWWGD